MKDITIAKVNYNANKQFVLKSFNVILEDIHMQYVLLSLLVEQTNPPEVVEKVLAYLFMEMRMYDPWVTFYRTFFIHEIEISKLANEKLNNAFYQINNTFSVDIEEGSGIEALTYLRSVDIESLLLLRDFYKYICLNMVLRSYSDANTESLAGLLCNKLVSQKITPGFGLIYTTFKTLVPFNEQGTLNYFKNTPDIIPRIQQFKVPIQHIAMEFMPMTLANLFAQGSFNYKKFSLEEVTLRYLDLIFQVTTTLYSAQNTFKYVHNDLHASNIMVSPFRGPMIYYIDEANLPQHKNIFDTRKFPRDSKGRIIFSNDAEIGIYKIIDHGRASVTGFNILSDTAGLIASTYGIDDYPLNDYSIDLLRLFVEMFDSHFYTALLININEGRADIFQQTLHNLFQQVFSCNLRINGEKMFVWMFDVRNRECEGDIDCQRLFDWFGMYGLGNGPRCERTESATPENILRHFNIFCDPELDIDAEPFKFNMLGGLQSKK